MPSGTVHAEDRSSTTGLPVVRVAVRDQVLADDGSPPSPGSHLSASYHRTRACSGCTLPGCRNEEDAPHQPPGIPEQDMPDGGSVPFPAGADDLPDLVGPAPHDQLHGESRRLDPSIDEVCGLTHPVSAVLASGLHWQWRWAIWASLRRSGRCPTTSR